MRFRIVGLAAVAVLACTSRSFAQFVTFDSVNLSGGPTRSASLTDSGMATGTTVSCAFSASRGASNTFFISQTEYDAAGPVQLTSYAAYDMMPLFDSTPRPVPYADGGIGQAHCRNTAAAFKHVAPQHYFFYVGLRQAELELAWEADSDNVAVRVNETRYGLALGGGAHIQLGQNRLSAGLDLFSGDTWITWECQFGKHAAFELGLEKSVRKASGEYYDESIDSHVEESAEVSFDAVRVGLSVKF